MVVISYVRLAELEDAITLGTGIEIDNPQLVFKSFQKNIAVKIITPTFAAVTNT